MYIIVQFLGGIGGTAVTWLVYPNGKDAAFLGAFVQIEPQIGLIRGFLLETILSFIFVLTYFGSYIKPQHCLEETGLEPVGLLFALIPIGNTLQ